MVIGRSVSFSDPRGVPQIPQNPPPPEMRFQNPRNIFEKKKLVGKKTQKFFAPPNPPPQFFFFLRFKTPGTFLSGIFFLS